MSRTQLTVTKVRALRSAKSTRNARDAALAGFGVRNLPGGRKRYFLQNQHEGNRTWKIVGDPVGMTVDAAREKARGMLAAIRTGRPVSDKETRFEVVAEAVFRRYGRNLKPGTLAVNRHYLRKQILPWFRGRQISEITSRDVQDWFASLHVTPVSADRSAPVLLVIMKLARSPWEHGETLGSTDASRRR